jgi:hypothetical protein
MVVAEHVPDADDDRVAQHVLLPKKRGDASKTNATIGSLQACTPFSATKRRTALGMLPGLSVHAANRKADRSDFPSDAGSMD